VLRDAAAAEGPFPLVIYHAGAGSTFDDNSVLCEFLASHGYVVFGSAFQEPSGESFNVDGKHTSARDMQFLIGYAKQLANVDWRHVGVIGHSAGAHATLMYRAQADCLADAVVSLDTTQDYFSVAELRWEELCRTVVKNRRNMTGPLLMVANPHAYFQLADSLSLARRYYLTIKDLDHNNFVSQSSMMGELRHRLRFPTTAGAGAGPPNAEEVKERTRLTAVKAAYESLCIYLLHFLNAELKGDAAGKKFVATRYRDTPLAGAAPHVEYVPPGVAGAEPYAENSPQPPTPRQVRDFLRKHGSTKTIALFRRFQKDSPTQPVYHLIFGWALVSDLLDQGKPGSARATPNGGDQSGDNGRVRANRDADNQPGREDDFCRGVGDDPHGRERRCRPGRTPGASGESLAPGVEGRLADAVGGAERGDGLTGDLPAVNQIVPEWLGFGAAGSAAEHECGLLVAEKTAIVTDDARRRRSGRLRYSSAEFFGLTGRIVVADQ
jgi:hypothetical protein